MHFGQEFGELMLVFFLGYFYFGNCRWVTLYEKDNNTCIVILLVKFHKVSSLGVRHVAGLAALVPLSSFINQRQTAVPVFHVFFTCLLRAPCHSLPPLFAAKP